MVYVFSLLLSLKGLYTDTEEMTVTLDLAEHQGENTLSLRTQGALAKCSGSVGAGDLPPGHRWTSQAFSLSLVHPEEPFLPPRTSQMGRGGKNS